MKLDKSSTNKRFVASDIREKGRQSLACLSFIFTSNLAWHQIFIRDLVCCLLIVGGVSLHNGDDAKRID
jgi:hypothetical protein